jgi:hypothetical protein
MKRLVSTAAVWMLVLAGCSDDTHPTVDAGHHHAEAGTNLNAEGCEHLEKGPFVDLTGATDPGSAPELRADHKAYRVSIPAGAAGYVRFAADAVGDLVLFLDADPLLAVEDDKGGAITIEKSEKTIAECTIVKAKHTVPVAAVGTLRFKLGPSAAVAKVTIVVEEAAHAH